MQIHDQRGWDALIAIGYSIQQPRPRHPDAGTGKDRAASKKLAAAIDEERRDLSVVRVFERASGLN
jgi:hypothetical protein